MSDTAARSLALDPAQSFIVQAPAGSGKTELLIQRYLRLLATVAQPEQIVAITFTRKAAAEMRRRVQLALRRVAEGAAALKPHERTTFELARAVMERDSELEWHLLDQPQRLRIDTLDAFNAWLARQLPVLADGVAAAEVRDKPDELYRTAARRTVAAVTNEDDTVSSSVATLLRALGNDFQQLERLLAALLPRRDQWLGLAATGAGPELRRLLEGALQRLVDDELTAVAALCPHGILARLAPLVRHAASHAGEGTALSLAPWLALERPPAAGPVALAAWRGVAALLLTKQGEWRKRVSKAEGFGAPYAALRDELRGLIAELERNEPLRAALRTASALPDAEYTDAQWQMLVALHDVLMRLAAELKVTFADERAVDFVELALAAQRALGQVDAPSELLLALDHRIQHLLVDEFQDTSQSQRRLLELLTAGWQADDGRTLFLVGDPLQSIYRFRDADMSLFLLAKERGVGNVPVRSLTLEQNFRSGPALVKWANAAFAQVFTAEDDLAAGRAAFRASTAARPPAPDQFVRVVSAERSEIEEVVAILAREWRDHPTESIAVLVQSRSHLAGLRARLRELALPAHAVEIDSLAEHTVAQDLAALTRALLHSDDRIAWLAVLHAPWCGLTWADLHALCHDDVRGAILDLAHQPERLARLSGDGQRRLAILLTLITAASARRGELSLARWIEQTWASLDGPACLDGPSEQLAAEQFFELLSRADRYGDLDDPAELHELLETILPQADPPSEQGIEIMTMHRAKGLEFDTVVLLGLSREPRRDEAQVLQWLARVAADGRNDLIMVPAADPGASRLTEFVRRAERDRDVAERARLLYVAATRARERLYVVWQQPAGGEPATGSMLAHLWPAVSAERAATLTATAPPHSEPRSITPVLRRLVNPRAHDERPSSSGVVRDALPRPEYAWAGEAAVHVGTVVHRYLQRFAEEGLAAWALPRIESQRRRFDRELELLGVEPRDREFARERVVLALTRALADPHGRWLLGPHEEAGSEVRLTVRAGHVLEHLRIDRTFVAEGKRWIVDFKTSQHEGSDSAAFVDSEVLRYAPQLERYARAFSAIDNRPLQLGLYFPLLGVLADWAAAATTSPSG